MSARKDAPDGIVIYRKSWETAQMFKGNEEAAGRLLIAVADYFLDGVEPEFSDLAMKLAFANFKADIEQGWKRFNSKCEAARNRQNPTKTDRIRKNPTESNTEPVNLSESVIMDIVNSETDTDRQNPTESERIHEQPTESVNDREKPNHTEFEGCSENLTTEAAVNGSQQLTKDVNLRDIEKSQSVSQSDKSGSGGDGPTDGQTFSTPTNIKTAWTKYYMRNMSASDELGIKALLDIGYSEKQIIDNIRDTAEYKPTYPLRYLKKALQEETPTRSPDSPDLQDARVSERERENYRRFQEYLESTHI